MKNILFLIFISFLTGCSKELLEEKPRSIVVENFYNTAQEVESGIFEIYRTVKQYNGFGFLYPAQLESYSDFIHGRGSYDFLSNFQGLDATNIPRVGQIWDVFYQGIRNANLVIANTPNSSMLSSQQIESYVAEAKFMRALLYYHIVQNWGKAILRSENNMLEQHIPLSPASEVYSFIESDLMAAEQGLPDVASIAGRPSKWSAKTVLAEVYMTQKKYSEAFAKSKEVMGANKYTLVPVSNADDYSKLFGPDVVNTTEEIFYLKYSRDPGQGWDYVNFLHHPSDPYYNGSGLYALYLDTVDYAVYKTWDNNDLRKKLWYSWDFGLGKNTLLSLKFIDPERVSQGGNDYPLYRYADLLLLYAEAAARVNEAPDPEAIEALNKVHRRAYGYPPQQASPVDYTLHDFTGLDGFLDRVLTERGYEIVLEGGKRWLDLKRSGKVKERILASTGKTVADKHMLWPFPGSEFNYNEAIDLSRDQNPGY